ncbi:MAG: hypothetical protein LBU35_01220 [Holosporales bacterium]|nr:hypothetical protein [Holosporales bacterium]
MNFFKTDENLSKILGDKKVFAFCDIGEYPKNIGGELAVYIIPIEYQDKF